MLSHPKSKPIFYELNTSRIRTNLHWVSIRFHWASIIPKCFLFYHVMYGGASGKELSCQSRRCKRPSWTTGSGRSLEEGMATHSSILAWRIQWTKEPNGLLSIALQRVRHEWNYWACTHAPCEEFSFYILVLSWAVLCCAVLCWATQSCQTLQLHGLQPATLLSPWGFPRQEYWTGLSWCWSWNSNTLATWCEELTHLKRPWWWERLRAGEGDDRGWDGWMVSPTQWTWVWVNSGSWWWTERPGVLQSMGLQRVGHDWATEMNWAVTPSSRGSSQPRDQTQVSHIASSFTKLFIPKNWVFEK